MLIQIEDVHFTYPGGVKALQGVSLAFHPGEKVALVGENGSGKTTLARHLNGLLRPDSGRVLVGDWQTRPESGRETSPAQLAQRVAYVFQNPDEQLFRRSVWDEVAFGPQNLKYRADRIDEMVEGALEMVGLNQAAKINPRDLGYSGRKRVALASALAMHTPVLVLDEPTAGLDANELAQLAQILAALHRQGKTILVISHDMDFVAENTDRVVWVHAGRVIRDAETAQFFGQPSSLVPPQMVRLSQRLGQARLALSAADLVRNFR